MEQKQKLYLIETFNGYATNSKCERYIWNSFVRRLDKKIVNEDAKNKILEIVKQLHNEFFNQNPKARKDKDFVYKFSETLEGYVVLALGSSDVCSIIYFKPRNILSDSDIIDFKN